MISSASVRVGDSSDSTPCVVLTDSTGLAKFEPDGCPGLKGPVTVTVSATGYAAATWIGVNGTNLTIPIRDISPPDVATATVSGTIAGWDSLPVPPLHHQTLALIGSLAVGRAGRSRQRPEAGDARCRRGPDHLHHSLQPVRAEPGGQRLQLDADDAHRGAGAPRADRRSVRQQHAGRRHGRHVHVHRHGDQDRAQLRRRTTSPWARR